MDLNENQARQKLEALVERYYSLPAAEKNAASESSVLGSFIEPLFRDVLGWPTDDLDKFAREKAVVKGKRVDRILHTHTGERIFIEAKRFGLIERLSNSNEWALRPGQLALPGLATDRSPEEQQAINYAFENGGKWALLSNFEVLRLFNARRDWLLLSFETPAAYRDEFDLLWQLSWQNINHGSLEQLNSQRAVKDVDTDYLHFINEQREQLAIDINLNREKNGWAYTADGKLRLSLLRSVVQRFLDRLVVIRFAEDHNVINGSPLQKAYDYSKNNPYARDLRDQLADIFHFFNQLHNSTLFAPDEVDTVFFSDAVLFPLIEKLYQARFRAMPADIIGNTYEQYLGKTLALEDGAIVIRDNLETRKAQGSYYTPQYIVRFIVDHTLGRYLYGTYDGKSGGKVRPGQGRKTAADIRDLRVLDSACGSGSFLIYAYQVLAEFYQAEVRRLTQLFDQKIKDLAAKFDEVTIDDRIAVQRIENERNEIRDNYPSLILETHLYGTDLDPQAAEIAAVNLILRALEGKGSKKLPLILNQNIKVGNALIGLPPANPRLEKYASDLAAIRRLRFELIETENTDPRHAEIQAELQTTSNRLKALFLPEFARRFPELERVRPFHWAIEFPEVFLDKAGQSLEKDAGFHFVFGNPPYGARLSKQERAYLRREYKIGMTNTAGLFMAQPLQALRIGRGGGMALLCLNLSYTPQIGKTCATAC